MARRMRSEVGETALERDSRRGRRTAPAPSLSKGLSDTTTHTRSRMCNRYSLSLSLCTSTRSVRQNVRHSLSSNTSIVAIGQPTSTTGQPTPTRTPRPRPRVSHSHSSRTPQRGGQGHSAPSPDPARLCLWAVRTTVAPSPWDRRAAERQRSQRAAHADLLPCSSSLFLSCCVHVRSRATLLACALRRLTDPHTP